MPKKSKESNAKKKHKPTKAMPIGAKPKRLSEILEESGQKKSSSKSSSGYGIFQPEAGTTRAMVVYLDISDGKVSNASFEWEGPSRFSSLAERAIASFRNVQWESRDVVESLRIEFWIPAVSPSVPDAFFPHLDALTTEVIPGLFATCSTVGSMKEPRVVDSPIKTKDYQRFFAKVAWQPKLFDKGKKKQHSTSVTSTEGMLEKLQAEDIVNTLQSEGFTTEELRGIADAARKECIVRTIESITPESSAGALVSCLEDLVKNLSVAKPTQIQNQEALQMILDGLYGEKLADYETNKHVADLVNVFRESCGLSFYDGEGEDARQINFTARETKGSTLGEFYAKTSDTRKRVGNKPWAIFPSLTVKKAPGKKPPL